MNEAPSTVYPASMHSFYRELHRAIMDSAAGSPPFLQVMSRELLKFHDSGDKDTNKCLTNSNTCNCIVLQISDNVKATPTAVLLLRKQIQGVELLGARVERFGNFQTILFEIEAF